MKVVGIALVLLVAQANAFWFFGRNEQTTATADGAPVEESCLAQGRSGSCEFFNCFERRLPCGRDFYMLRFGNHYCNRFQRYRDTFTPEGQTFLNRSQQCVTEGLLEQYGRDYVNCHDLEHLAVRLIRPCYLQHGFCQVIAHNSDQFLRVFQLRDLFSNGAGKLWREVAGLARECGGRALLNFWRVSSTRLSPLRYLFDDDDDEDEEDEEDFDDIPELH